MAFSSSAPAFANGRTPGAGVTAVLGPTNTGKTNLAIERMLAHSSGVIGLPLRLLAREVYNKIVDRAGAESVALITGEEKIKPKNPRFWVSTVEAMPRDLDVSFLAVDEIQIAADLERGHVFTDRILHRRGRDETLLLGAATMRPIIERLLPGASLVPPPQPFRIRADRRPRRARHPRRHVWNDGPLRAVRAGTGQRAAEPHLRQCEGFAMAQLEAGFFLAGRAAGVAGADARSRSVDPRPDRGGLKGARSRRARCRCARDGAWRSRGRTAVGRLP